MSSDFVTVAKHALRDSGARVTKPRITILKQLASSERALTAKELYEITKVDQVSIYRTLETLSSLGLVHQVSPSGGFIACEHPDCNSSVHLIVHCENCKGVNELHLPVAYAKELLRFVEEKLEFEPSLHGLHLSGVCKKCEST